MSVPIPATEVICWRCKNDITLVVVPTRPNKWDWEADTKLATVGTVSKTRFDPQVIIIPSSPEGWPSDSAWDTFGVSTRSKGETKSVSTREEKKKKGKKPISVPSESSSDSDSEPVKLDTYKDDISTLVREALKGQTSDDYSTDSNEDSAYDSDESSVNFLQCYEADAADLEAYHEEIHALYVSGLESEAEKPIPFRGAEIYNLQRPRTEGVSNLSSDAHYPLAEGKKGGDTEETNGKFADLQEEAKRAVPDTPLPEREDTDAGATTFTMTEGMIRKEDWKTLEMSDLKGILPEIGTHRIDLQPGAVPVRQRQYRLNEKYSLLVKENIDSLLDAGFIYHVLSSD
ncbi:hypothetical protein R1sor_023746 [Riccia sorocarpa]|uniref:Uncharacterized protein n=1 Tax=Riccia sorocarpa TaxID=122646 RepID=A0ABD3GNJ2_9MARC